MTFGSAPGPVGAPKAAAANPRIGWQRIKAVILPFLWPRESTELRVRVVAAFALLVLAKLITVQVPFFFKAVVDRLTAAEGALIALPLAALLAYGLARLLAAGFGELRDAIFAKVAERAARRVSLKVFEHLFQLSLRYHLERRTGELARITERGVQAIRFLLGVILFNVGPTLLEFGLVIGILLHQYPWYFALVTFLTIATYAAFTFIASEWRIAIRREMNARDNEVAAQTVDSLLNYETVKAFTNERLERDRLDRTPCPLRARRGPLRDLARRAQLRPGGGDRGRGHGDHGAGRQGRRRRHADGRRHRAAQRVPVAALSAAQLPGRRLPSGQAVADRSREPDGPARSRSPRSPTGRMRRRWRSAAASSASRTWPSATTRRGRSCTGCRSRCRPAIRSRWSAARAPASRRWCVSCSASTTSTGGGS